MKLEKMALQPVNMLFLSIRDRNYAKGWQLAGLVTC